MVTGERHVLSLNGTKEGLFLVAELAVPQEKRGQAPVVLMPNPYYLVYNGAAAMAGAESVFLDATASDRIPARPRRHSRSGAGAHGALLSVQSRQSARRDRRPRLSQAGDRAGSRL